MKKVIFILTLIASLVHHNTVIVAMQGDQPKPAEQPVDKGKGEIPDPVIVEDAPAAPAPAASAVEEETPDCSICFEKFDQAEYLAVTLPCEHTFCSTCLNELLDTGRTNAADCALCRAEYTAEDIQDAIIIAKKRIQFADLLAALETDAIADLAPLLEKTPWNDIACLGPLQHAFDHLAEHAFFMLFEKYFADPNPEKINIVFISHSGNLCKFEYILQALQKAVKNDEKQHAAVYERMALYILDTCLHNYEKTYILDGQMTPLFITIIALKNEQLFHKLLTLFPHLRNFNSHRLLTQAILQNFVPAVEMILTHEHSHNQSSYKESIITDDHYQIAMDNGNGDMLLMLLNFVNFTHDKKWNGSKEIKRLIHRLLRSSLLLPMTITIEILQKLNSFYNEKIKPNVTTEDENPIIQGIASSTYHTSTRSNSIVQRILAGDVSPEQLQILLDLSAQELLGALPLTILLDLITAMAPYEDGHPTKTALHDIMLKILQANNQYRSKVTFIIQTGRHGYTPLHLACTYNLHDIQGMLLAFGASEKADNAFGNKPVVSPEGREAKKNYKVSSWAIFSCPIS